MDEPAVSRDLRRFDASQGPRILGPRDGLTLDLGGAGARFMIWDEESGGGFSLVQHPIPPRHLCAPLHRHTREDEYSYVIEGRLGAQLGDDTVYADAGDLVFKPRDQWHTFWNAGDTPCRILEIISPGGFEHFFDEIVAGTISPEDQKARYGSEADPGSIQQLCQQHGLLYPPLSTTPRMTDDGPGRPTGLSATVKWRMLAEPAGGEKQERPPLIVRGHDHPRRGTGCGTPNPRYSAPVSVRRPGQ